MGSHPPIRCSKEDSSLTLTPTDIDSVSTINKFQLTAHTEPESPTTKETVPLSSTVTKEVSLTTNQTPEVDQRKTSSTRRHNLSFSEQPVDTLTLIQILHTSNQELSGIKFSARKKEKHSSKTCLVLSVPSPTDQFKKVSFLM